MNCSGSWWFRLWRSLRCGVPFWPSTRQVAQDVGALDQLIYGMINERRESGTPGNDLMGMLLAARDQDTGEGMDEKQTA